MGFYDPIKNQTYSNVSAILYFLEKGAQPTGTVYDILRKAEFFQEFRVSFEKKRKVQYKYKKNTPLFFFFPQKEVRKKYEEESNKYE